MKIPIILRSVLSISALGLAFGCSAFTDPAVRFAKCVERESKSLDRSSGDRASAQCRLGTEGGYLVVLHPAGQLSDEELIRGGVPERVVPVLRQARLGDDEAVYVFPGESPRAMSRTTYQHRFVRIPRLLVAEKERPEPVVVDLARSEGAEDAKEIQALR